MLRDEHTPLVVSKDGEKYGKQTGIVRPRRLVRRKEHIVVIDGEIDPTRPDSCDGLGLTDAPDLPEDRPCPHLEEIVPLLRRFGFPQFLLKDLCATSASINQ
jgi:hypothetical protein